MGSIWYWAQMGSKYHFFDALVALAPQAWSDTADGGGGVKLLNSFIPDWRSPTTLIVMALSRTYYFKLSIWATLRSTRVERRLGFQRGWILFILWFFSRAHLTIFPTLVQWEITFTNYHPCQVSTPTLLGLSKWGHWPQSCVMAFLQCKHTTIFRTFPTTLKA